MLELATKQVTHDPVCPHCEKEITEIHWRQMQAMNAEYLFMCPHCRKVLGIGVRKSLWFN